MRWLLVVQVALTTLVFAQPGFAQEPGVTYDPDSPAGKEYALPLDDARSATSGGDSSGAAADRAGASASTLFGAGIEPPRSAPAGQRERSARDTRSPESQSAERQDRDEPAAEPPPAPSQVLAASGSASVTHGVLVGVGAAALGVMAGLLVRRRRRV